ncbi:MAG: ABC transporter transmembrane domain-containing protein [Oscillospiraceae bacterium]|nr:ABC transporter transmembrane domain-containing protein [Oscillospiraceae bacterium]
MKTHIPSYMLDAFGAQGIDTGKLIYAIHTDLTSSGAGADVYTAVDDRAMYVLCGVEKVTRMDGARRIVALYEAMSLETYPLSELGELKSERLLSTGRLCGVQEDGDAKLLLVFSVGCLTFVERLIKAVNNIKEGRDPLFEVPVDDRLFCPKCGARYPEPDRKICPKCLDQIGITRRLMRFFGDYKARVALIIAVMLLGTVFSVLSPYIGTRLLLDEVLTEGGGYYGLVGAIVLVILAVRAIGVALQILYGYVLAKTVPWIVYDLKLKIFEAMQRLSVSFYTSKRTGALMNRVNNDANSIYWFFVDGMPYLVVNLFTFTGVILLMCILNFRLAIASLIIVPATIGLFRILWGVFRRFHHKDWVYRSQLNSMVSDSISGQRVIKAYAREDEESGRFSGVSGKQAGIDIRANNVGFTAFPLIYLLMFAGQVIVTVMGSMMVLRGEITLGTMLTFVAYLTMLYGPLEFMSWVSNWWARCVDAAQRVFEIIDAKPDVDEPESPVILSELKGDIEVRDAWFEYDPATPVLRGLSLTVEAGKMLGVAGKTGAGKSTLANLIARLYDVTGGAVEIDGVNVKKLSLAQLRGSVGIVSQDIYLFIGTIADNIRYAKPDSGIEDVIRAAKAASAHDFIMNLPDGYETRVGAGGQDLSGGEKQRLSIARTIIQNPKILILDEATAAMDTETEAAIQASLAKLQSGRTTISIAHRLSTLRDADSLAVIGEGKVVEIGTHAELMAKKGEYHKLYSIQMEGLKVINMDA